MILAISPKSVYASLRLKQEAAKAKVALEILDVKELAGKNFAIDINRYQLLYIRQAYPYFNEIIGLAQRFLKAGKCVIDQGITKGDMGLGKMDAYGKMQNAGLPIPKTCWLQERLGELDNKGLFPFILKWNYGFKGRQVFLIKSRRQLDKTARNYPVDELIYQHLVPAEFEYKVMTVGFKALPAVLKIKTDPETFRPDFKNHQILHNQSLDEKALFVSSLAEESAKALGRELAKTDILEAAGKFYILETNRTPGLESFERLTGYNASARFLQYLQNKEVLV